MTRMTGPDCVVMCNLINTHTHTYMNFSGANRDRDISIFPVQLTTSRIGNLTRFIHTLIHVVPMHACIHEVAALNVHFQTL